ncbi:MAG: tetratricopeptide repeat protein [Candidatus Sericytochromatia bacterium]
MNNLNELIKQATSYHQSNQLQLAEQSYKQILYLNPNESNALNLLGVVYSQQNKHDEGIESIKKAIEINKNPMYFNNLGECYRLKGLYSEAEYNFYQAINLAAGFVEAYYNLANVLKIQGNINEAIENYNIILDINPNHLRALFNLGNIMLENKYFDKAISYYQKAININPNYTEALNNLNICINLKNKDDMEFNFMISNYKSKILSNSNDYISYNNLAKLYFKKENYNLAIENYRNSLLINNEQIDIYYELANVYIKLNQIKEAISCYKNIFNINPDETSVLDKIIYYYQEVGNLEEAKKYYYILANNKSNKILYEFLGDTLDAPISYNKSEVIEYQNNFSNNLDKYSSINFKIELSEIDNINLRIPLAMIYQGLEDKNIREKYSSIISKALIPNNYTQELRNKNIKPEIAFLVTKSHEGIFITCMKGILNNISTENFNITIISTQESYKTIIKPNLKNELIKFLALPDKISSCIDLIAKYNFDLLYYWEIGTDTMNYILPFFRLARVQCTSFGWPVTSGIKEVDYYISSDLMIDNDSYKEFSEKLVSLNSPLTYYYRTPLPKNFLPREHFGFFNDDKIYICTQNLRKIQPDFDKATLEILKRDPKATYLLFEDHNPNVTELLKKRLKENHGEYFNRIRFHPRIMRGADYINLVKISDVMLDTFNFGGVNTSYDAFSVGLPIITLPSNFQRSKYTYALYKTMGISDCIASNEDEFIDLAIKTANNTNFRESISKKILENQHLIFNDSKVTHEFEKIISKLLVRSQEEKK